MLKCCTEIGDRECRKIDEVTAQGSKKSFFFPLELPILNWENVTRAVLRDVKLTDSQCTLATQWKTGIQERELTSCSMNAKKFALQVQLVLFKLDLCTDKNQIKGMCCSRHSLLPRGQNHILSCVMFQLLVWCLLKLKISDSEPSCTQF